MQRFPNFSPLVLLSLLFIGGLACQAHANPNDGPEELVGAPPRSTSGAVTSAATTPDAAPTRSGMLWYRVVVGQDALSIQLRLLRPPKTLSLFLPGAWAGRDDWAKNLRISQARTVTGERPMTIERSSGRIDIEVGKSAWVELAYEVKLDDRRDHSSRFAPQHLEKGGGFLAYAPTFLILPSDSIARTLRDIPVEITADDELEIVSTWPLAQQGPSSTSPGKIVRGYLVEDVRALRDAFLAGSDAITSSRNEGLTIAYEESFSGDKDAFTENIQEIVAHYSERFGEVGQVSVFVRTPPSREDRLLWGTGRRNGFILELDKDAKLDRQTKILIAHEAFHLWNGHILIPEQSSELQTRWFKEGLTQYITLKHLYQMGALTQRDLLEEIALAASRYRRYSTSPGSAEDTSLYPYDRGLLLAMGLDVAIGEDSAWGLSLEDWLAALLERARRSSSWNYTIDELGDSLTELAGDKGATNKFFKTYCRVDRSLILSSFFEGMGLHYLDADRTRQAKLIPLADKRSGWRAILATPETTP